MAEETEKVVEKSVVCCHLRHSPAFTRLYDSHLSETQANAGVWECVPSANK